MEETKDLLLDRDRLPLILEPQVEFLKVPLLASSSTDGSATTSNRHGGTDVHACSSATCATCRTNAENKSVTFFASYDRTEANKRHEQYQEYFQTKAFKTHLRSYQQ